MNLARIVRRRLETLSHDMPIECADVIRRESQALAMIADEAQRIRDDQLFVVRRSRDMWRRLALMFAAFTLVLATIAAVRWFQ